ncbi:MAG: VCBS repeat-containing protein [Saprospiraceae bacterium]|nr:VCBS repeat-containing protein [Saprospiraceae bacterium]
MKKNLIISTLSCIGFLFCCNMACKKRSDQKLEGPLFSLLMPKETGIDFANQITETQEEYIYNFNYIYNGAGTGIADFNNDGLQDVYFVGNQVPDKLYLNKGNLTFEDISENAGIAKNEGWRSGITIVDINNDGYQDIYITRGGFKNDPVKNRNLLLVNQKNLTFKEEAAIYGIDDPGYSIAATFFDYDNDNDLDLYLTNRPDHWGINTEELVKAKELQKTKIDPLTSHHLYRNDGNKFIDVSKEAGIYPSYAYGLAAIAGDINKDGTQDLYVANDFIENDYFYINMGNGKFRESAKDVCNHVPYYAMGADFGDINNDGLEEIFVVEMRPEDYKRSKTAMPPMQPEFFYDLRNRGFADQYMHNVLQYNHGNGFFSDIAQMAGIEKTDWSWAALIFDLDNDGFKDIYVTNGYLRDVYDRDGNITMDSILKKSDNYVHHLEDALKYLPSVKLVNYIFQNNKSLHFKKMMKEWGMDQTSFSNGAAFGDLDNDGDLDLVVNNINDPAFVYRNNLNEHNNYLRIKLDGPETNRTGIGAKVTIHTGDKIQYQQFKTFRGYLSSCEPFVHFGLDDITQVDLIEVEWTDGKVQQIKNTKANQLLTIRYINSNVNSNPKPKINPQFEEQTEKTIIPPFFHRENNFDDYYNQKLLPHSLSKTGPHISVGDINRDGKEDFYIGKAHNQAGQVYIQTNENTFTPVKNSAFETDIKYKDYGSCFFDAEGDGDLDLYVVSGGTEFSKEHPIYQDRLYLNDGKGTFSKSEKSLPKISSSGSCVIAADIDGDGDIDLFRGGRCIPDQYPYAPDSYLLENNGKGIFTDVTDQKASGLRKIGMVTSAVWASLNGDKNPELIIVGEWMPITIFENSGGALTKVKQDKYGLNNTEGWWNRIVTADLDQDGDLDFVLGNLGMNYKFHASVEKPFQIYCDDFDKNGTFDIVLAKYNGGQMVPIRGRQCSSEQVPSIAKNFPSYNSYANASVNDIYGEGLKTSLHYEAKLFESIILKNNGTSFEIIPLPLEAQFSTIQGIAIEDFDQDGILDLVLGGNLFQAEIETTRADASIGLFLKGTKSKAMFSVIPVLQSGIFIPNDIKDIKSIRSNNKIHFLASANNSALVFFKNNK